MRVLLPFRSIALTTVVHSAVPCDDFRVQVNNHAILDELFSSAQRSAVNFGGLVSLPMKYGIFRGKSTLRDLPLSLERILNPEKSHIIEKSTSDKMKAAAQYRAAAVLLLLKHQADAAHEVLLGVTLDNLDEAEYAATHPGQTDWAQEHPLTDSADLLHAAVHRLEGLALGEGNHTGFDNAKFWLAGGPKGLKSPASHPVRVALAKRAIRVAPRCVDLGVVVPSSFSEQNEEGATHQVIASGGATRTIFVPPGEWDGFAFVDICRRRLLGELNSVEEEEVADLQRAEMLLLLQNELIEAGRLANLPSPNADNCPHEQM